MEDVYEDEVSASKPGADGELDLADDGDESQAQRAGAGKVRYSRRRIPFRFLFNHLSHPAIALSLSLFLTSHIFCCELDG